ncbi:glutaminyl-peptide cyclotransferase [Sphingomonas psychrotolerans]|uniref:Glutaminyl-peptide cyclotransferase n=1 Tax=Sphingomonas psychrotolerans TaxID=1327635 RepID=A0ABU3N6E1_9SPHN|nr:glutaminyl-peptide cyclotransferase [Sphingomonas psychrotolerans]MDT8759821.1 glutaminyl-peptide cyclotransferase [Sphingomonas psychrotolerans]
MRGKIIPLALLALAGCAAQDEMPKVQTVEVVKSYPHDSQAFTEGLFLDGGTLFESTGEEGTSGVRKVRLETGEVTAQAPLSSPYFGEGIIGWKDRLYQLTWKDQKGFIYDRATLTPKGEFAYTGEGWGLTHNGKSVIMSDGTDKLRFMDPDTMAQQSTLAVTANGCPVKDLNELEWIDGEIWANIWRTDLIARIDPDSGKVKGFVDVSALGPPTPSEDEVPNGIAYDAAAKRIFVTGKMWPQLYEVRVTDAAANGVAQDQAAALMRCQN